MGVRQSSQPKRVGRKPKFDYTGEEFLSRISDLARKGYTDREIAYTIGLSEEELCRKKSAIPQIAQALSHARAQVNSIVRAAFLKTALGGRTVRTTQYVQKKCECGGKKPDCPICDGTGWITPEQHKVVTEVELAPNLMAQQRWLMNYDSDWKKKVKGTDDEETAVEGIDIQVVYNDKKDLELQDKKGVNDETTG